MKKDFEIFEDKWLYSQCGRCFSTCAIRVRKVNGVAVKIEGNPDTWMGSKGGVCGKGASGLQVLYDPNRLNKPLRRTNPEKGIRVDPKWKEITWDEALEEIAAKLKKVMDDDPRKILLQSTTVRSPTASLGWRNMMAAMLGTPNSSVGGAGIHCGNGGHEACGLTHGSWDVLPDFERCNYAIYFGVNNGHATGHGAMITARRVANAMERGMKLVVFDPICNYSASHATEWVPLLPGTDLVVVLAMCNVILNEINTWDADYIKWKTNGAYLIKGDGRYCRDKKSGKPVVWDSVESRAKVFDDETIKDLAIEGAFDAKGEKCRTAFSFLRVHLKTYTPEMAEKISTVPAETIRRIAKEYAAAAQIGATITIDGHRLPLRPVAATTFRGGEGHDNAFHTCMAICTLNHLLGAGDVPGGAVGFPNTSKGYPETGELQFGVIRGPDGLISLEKMYAYHSCWPVKEPQEPKQLGLQDLFPMCNTSPIWAVADREEIWKKIGLPYRIEVVLNYGCNSIMGLADPNDHAEFLKSVPFIVSWDIVANEFAEGFADILLPDTCYLETFTWLDGQAYSFNYPYGMDPWCYHISQPVVEPEAERRYIMDASIDLVDRMGKRAELNEYWNRFIGLQGEEKIVPTEKITWEEIGDKGLKHYFGPEKGLAYFKEKGCVIWPKKVEEAYWRHFTNARLPLYMEWMTDFREKAQKIGEKVGIRVHWEQYTPLISWFPTKNHRIEDSEYDLFCFSYRDILHTASCTMEQPWLDEASTMSPYTYNICMNDQTAAKKGLKDQTVIEVKSIYGPSVRGILKTRAGQHPQTIAIAATAGHWAAGQPVAKGKGAHFNVLMKAKFDESDPITLNLETSVRVKVSEVREK